MEIKNIKIEKIIEMIDDLGWEYQRMSSSGQKTYEELCLLQVQNLIQGSNIKKQIGSPEVLRKSHAYKSSKDYSRKDAKDKLKNTLKTLKNSLKYKKNK